jgi:hypothetical protein
MARLLPAGATVALCRKLISTKEALDVDVFASSHELTSSVPLSVAVDSYFASSYGVQLSAARLAAFMASVAAFDSIPIVSLFRHALGLGGRPLSTGVVALFLRAWRWCAIEVGSGGSRSLPLSTLYPHLFAAGGGGGGGGDGSRGGGAGSEGAAAAGAGGGATPLGAVAEQTRSAVVREMKRAAGEAAPLISLATAVKCVLAMAGGRVPPAAVQAYCAAIVAGVAVPVALVEDQELPPPPPPPPGMIDEATVGGKPRPPPPPPSARDQFVEVEGFLLSLCLWWQAQAAQHTAALHALLVSVGMQPAGLPPLQAGAAGGGGAAAAGQPSGPPAGAPIRRLSLAVPLHLLAPDDAWELVTHALLARTPEELGTRWIATAWAGGGGGGGGGGTSDGGGEPSAAPSARRRAGGRTLPHPALLATCRRALRLLQLCVLHDAGRTGVLDAWTCLTLLAASGLFPLSTFQRHSSGAHAGDRDRIAALQAAYEALVLLLHRFATLPVVLSPAAPPLPVSGVLTSAVPAAVALASTALPAPGDATPSAVAGILPLRFMVPPLTAGDAVHVASDVARASTFVAGSADGDGYGLSVAPPAVGSGGGSNGTPGDDTQSWAPFILRSTPLPVASSTAAAAAVAGGDATSPLGRGGGSVQVKIAASGVRRRSIGDAMQLQGMRSARSPPRGPASPTESTPPESPSPAASPTRLQVAASSALAGVAVDTPVDYGRLCAALFRSLSELLASPLAAAATAGGAVPQLTLYDVLHNESRRLATSVAQPASTPRDNPWLPLQLGHHDHCVAAFLRCSVVPEHAGIAPTVATSSAAEFELAARGGKAGAAPTSPMHNRALAALGSPGGASSSPVPSLALPGGGGGGVSPGDMSDAGVDAVGIDGTLPSARSTTSYSGVPATNRFATTTAAAASGAAHHTAGDPLSATLGVTRRPGDTVGARHVLSADAVARAAAPPPVEGYGDGGVASTNAAIAQMLLAYPAEHPLLQQLQYSTALRLLRDRELRARAAVEVAGVASPRAGASPRRTAAGWSDTLASPAAHTAADSTRFGFNPSSSGVQATALGSAEAADGGDLAVAGAVKSLVPAVLGTDKDAMAAAATGIRQLHAQYVANMRELEQQRAAEQQAALGQVRAARGGGSGGGGGGGHAVHSSGPPCTCAAAAPQARRCGRGAVHRGSVGAVEGAGPPGAGGVAGLPSGCHMGATCHGRVFTRGHMVRAGGCRAARATG